MDKEKAEQIKDQLTSIYIDSEIVRNGPADSERAFYVRITSGFLTHEAFVKIVRIAEDAGAGLAYMVYADQGPQHGIYEFHA